MTTQRTTARTQPTHHEQDRGVALLPGLLTVVAVLGGGWVAAQHWLAAQCPVTPQLAQVCATVLG